MKKIIAIVVVAVIAIYGFMGLASQKAVAGQLASKAQQLRALEAELGR